MNIGEIRELSHRGRTVRTGIWKLPVEGPVAVGAEGLDGDVQADRRLHGGADKAVYAYSVEDYGWWQREMDLEWHPGLFGENLTVDGPDLTGAVIGERWRAGSALVEVSEPRTPCYKLALKLGGDMRWVKRFARALRLGTYLRVVEPGAVAAGAPLELVSRPSHGITVGMLGQVALGERRLARRVLAAPELGEGWRSWLEERAAKAS